MPLLIDGHNLIGQLPDLSLDDPDDEAKLVDRVRRYCFRHHRRATVVFDRGLPGGPSYRLSSPEVKVFFATSGATADGLIKRHLRQVQDPAGLLVVSSDRAVQAAARRRGARVVTAAEFAAELAAPEPTGAGSGKPERLGSVDEWLQLFEEGG
ncbi:MAG: NYN domain-containing protein [Anaerolineae bacterium]|jgi:predicted RNA-binding protein with PIN domain